MLREMLGSDWELREWKILGVISLEILHKPTSRQWHFDPCGHLTPYSAEGSELQGRDFDSPEEVVLFLKTEAEKGPLVDEGPFSEELQSLRAEVRSLQEEVQALRKELELNKNSPK